MSTGPEYGLIGLTDGVKERRVDFVGEEFELLVETKGARFAWTRALQCPCKPINDQTQQPDYNCPLCKRLGYVFFGPKDYAPPFAAGTLNSVQQAVVDKDGAAVIRGVVQSVGRNVEAYDKLGPWVFGSAVISVRYENKIGYWDRLVNLDAEVNFTETVNLGTNLSLPVPLRYPATGVNIVMDHTGKRYEQGEDFNVNLAGQLEWVTGFEPPAEARLSAHYLTHPSWLVWEHPHAFRETSIKFKKATTELATPLGDPQPLPIHALMRLEYLVET